MKERSDQELLQTWSRDRSEEAFRALAERYTNLVFGTAARRVADRRLAEEVSQNVFIALARKAGKLNGENGIGGWLFKTTVLEAAAMRRSETRRDNRMRELTELEEALRCAGGEALGGEALEIVDNGLAGLGESDRGVLISRFFNGASYEEMAVRSGRSEAACRKQVSRALQKLADVLQRRGVCVSTTVLAAGLGVMMTTKAPAGLAASCATGAMAAGSAASSGLLTTILTAMTTSKVTSALVIGGILLLVTTGTGYLVGKKRAEEAVGGTADGAAESSPAASKKSQARSGDRVGAKGGGPGGAAQAGNRVAQIVSSLRKQLRGKGWDEAMTLGPPLVKELSAAEMEEAFALVGGERGDSLQQTMKVVLYSHWGTLDGRAAAERAIGEEEENLRRIALTQTMLGWAGTDSESAMAWQEELMKKEDLPVDEATGNRLLGAILHGWAKTDVNGAFDKYESLGSDQQRMALGSLDTLIRYPELRAAVGARVAEIVDEKLRSRTAEEVGEFWARIDPRAAAEWFTTVEFEDPMLRLRAAMELGEGWFDVDPKEAASWIWPMVPDQMKSRFVKELTESPFGQDKEAMGAWLQERGFKADGTPEQ